MKHWKIRTASALMPLSALLILATPAGAMMKWCKTDPIVRLNGTQVQVLVSVPEEYQALVDGPIKVEFKAPKLAERELLFTDAGFNGHGEVVKFRDLGAEAKGWERHHREMPLRVKVKVPIDKGELPKGVREVPVQVEVITDRDGVRVVEGEAERNVEVDLPITTTEDEGAEVVQP